MAARLAALLRAPGRGRGWCQVQAWQARGLGAGVGVAVGLAVGIASAVPTAQCERISANRPLAERHRVSLCGWPMKGARAAKDPRVATLELLFEHAKKAGYDGIEAGCDDLREMGFFGAEPIHRHVSTHTRGSKTWTPRDVECQSRA